VFLTQFIVDVVVNCSNNSLFICSLALQEFFILRITLNGDGRPNNHKKDGSFLKVKLCNLERNFLQDLETPPMENSGYKQNRILGFWRLN